MSYLKSRGGFARVGPKPEWHLLLAEAVQHLAFDLAPRLAEESVVLGPPLPQPDLNPVRTVGHWVARDRVEQPLAQPRTAPPAAANTGWNSGDERLRQTLPRL